MDELIKRFLDLTDVRSNWFREDLAGERADYGVKNSSCMPPAGVAKIEWR
jgi:hypothetical protein